MISPHLWTARLKKPSPQNTPTWTAESYSHDLRKKVFRWEFQPWLFVIPKSLLLWNTLVLSTHGGFCKNLALRVVCQHWGPEKIHLKHRNNSSELEKHLPTAWGDQWQSLPERVPETRGFCLPRQYQDCSWVLREALPSQDDPEPPQSLQARQTLDWKKTKRYPGHPITGAGYRIYLMRTGDEPGVSPGCCGARRPPSPGSSFVLHVEFPHKLSSD